MSKSESSVQAEIVRNLKDLGHYPVRVSRSNVSGIPDLIVCLKPSGLFLAIECKRSSGGKVSALQARSIAQIREAGGYAMIAESWEDVRIMLTKILNRPESSSTA